MTNKSKSSKERIETCKINRNFRPFCSRFCRRDRRRVCGVSSGTTGGSGVDPNETAATVNGKAIKMEEVDRAVKQQAQGQESQAVAAGAASAGCRCSRALSNRK